MEGPPLFQRDIGTQPPKGVGVAGARGLAGGPDGSVKKKKSDFSQ